MRTVGSLLLLGLLLPSLVVAQQRPPIDVKYQDVGNIKLQVTNMGGFTRWGLDVDWKRLVCEWPQGSFIEHVNGAGIRVGAIVNGEPHVSWGYAEFAGFSKCFPSYNPADTIWVASSYLPLPPGLTDMYPGYVPKSEMDFVCQYWDNIVQAPEHVPLHVHFIQRTYTWSYAPLYNIIYIDYDIICENHDGLDSAYVAFFFDADVGKFETEDDFNFFNDDYSWYDEEERLAVTQDAPGGPDGDARSGVGVKLLRAPGRMEELTFTFRTGNRDNVDYPTDSQKYRAMSEGIIMPSMTPGEATQTAFLFGFGPFRLSYGDTLPLTFAMVCGHDEAQIRQNAQIAQWLYDRNWAAPNPPPPPPLKAYPGDRSVRLEWRAGPAEVNPEAYVDTLRLDGNLLDFEGYRIYKSTEGRGGPWALLAEFDRADDVWGPNVGLAYEFVDEGLVNGTRYYYAATSFDMPDTVLKYPSLEGGITRNVVMAIPGTPPATGRELNVYVVPNPYRADAGYAAPKGEVRPPGADWEWPLEEGRGWVEHDRKIQFVNLPRRCTIRIFTLAGDLVDTIHHDDPVRGSEDWHLISRIRQAVASELYLFTVEDLDTGATQSGTFVIIK